MGAAPPRRLAQSSAGCAVNLTRAARGPERRHEGSLRALAPHHGRQRKTLRIDATRHSNRGWNGKGLEAIDVSLIK